METNDKRAHKRLVSQILRIVVLLIISAVLVYLGMIARIRKEVSYNEKNDITYKVYLKENKFYEDKYLKENMQYVSSLINYIDVDFKSIFNIDDISNLDYNYSIKGYLNITDTNNNDKTLFSKEYSLVENKKGNVEQANSFEILEPVRIDYEKYNRLAQSFKSAYTSNAHATLLLELKVNFISKPNIFENNFTDSYTANIAIPLTTQTLDIKQNAKSDSENIVKTEINTTDVSYILYGIAVLPALFALILLVGTIKYIKRKVWTSTEYDTYIKKILREYETLIVEIEGEYDFSKYDVIDVKIFDELIGIYESINQPIMCMKDKVTNDEKETIFFIKNNNDVYRYIVKEKNFMNI